MERQDTCMKVLPAEWAPQSAVMLTWPHSNTDWQPILPQITDTYVRMATEIVKRERLIIVTPEPNKVRQLLPHSPRITYVKCDTNDTWARDHGFITLVNRDQQNPFSVVPVPLTVILPNAIVAPLAYRVSVFTVMPLAPAIVVGIANIADRQQAKIKFLFLIVVIN